MAKRNVVRQHSKRAVVELSAVTSSGLPRYLSAKQVAEHLQVSYLTVWRAIDRGELECVKFGRLLRVTPAGLTRYLSANARGAS